MNDYYAHKIYRLEAEYAARKREQLFALRGDVFSDETPRPFSRFMGMIMRLRVISRRTPRAVASQPVVCCAQHHA